MDQITSELEEIIGLISSHPKGVSATDLLSELSKPLQRRTLLRRLDILLDNQQIARRGKGKNTRYFLNVERPTEVYQVSENNNVFQISIIARKIQLSVNQPRSARKKVGYQYSFLDSYIPNETSYLRKSEREFLETLDAKNDGEAPAGTFARKILDRFLIDLTWNSSRLEGNTYSLLETEHLLHQGNTLADKTPAETQMILNHKAAIEFLVESCEDIKFNKLTICNIHAILADNLLNNPQAYGSVRKIPVGIGSSVYTPLNVPQQLEDYLEILLSKASKIKNPFEQSLFAMIHLPYLQPFEDVNKRVSRLSANIPFIKNNYCPISFVDVPKKTYVEGLLGVYELNKIDLLKELFLWAYERSVYRYAEIRHTVGEPDQFRLKYRNLIYELVKLVVTTSQSKLLAIKSIREYANKEVPKVDQERFIEIVETDLLSLHMGNFYRYKITPNEFIKWQSSWGIEEN